MVDSNFGRIQKKGTAMSEEILLCNFCDKPGIPGLWLCEEHVKEVQESPFGFKIQQAHARGVKDGLERASWIAANYCKAHVYTCPCLDIAREIIKEGENRHGSICTENSARKPGSG